jgi:hypothetical protein
VLTDNNLGGQGPTTGPQRIYYKNAGSLAGGGLIDLEVTNTSAYAGNTSKNGINGMFGEINVKRGTFVDLKFKFIKDGKPLQIPKVDMSFWDLDQGKAGGAAEKIVVGPLTEYYVSPHTLVRASSLDDQTLMFESTVKGVHDDNPSSFDTLTETQVNKGVEVGVTMESEMMVKFVVTPTNKGKKPGRSFLFAGASPLNELEPTPVGICAEYARLDFANYDGGTPLSGMGFKKVAMLPDGTVVDATLTADSSYEAANESKNGEAGGLVNINLKGNVTSEFTLKFSEKMAKFFITFLDVDSPKYGNEYLHIDTSSYHKYFISAHENIAVALDGSVTQVSSRESGFLENNPTSRSSLTSKDLSRAVTFFFKDATDVVKFTYLGDNALKGRNFLLTGETPMVCSAPAPEPEPEP